MSRVSIVALLASFIASSAVALPANIDTDGNGLASLSELQVMYPEVTDDLFQEIDLDHDGYVNDEEMVTAIGGELIAVPEGDL